MRSGICFDECWLEGYGHTCSSNIQGHHFVSKSKTRRAKAAREGAEELVVPVCRIANAELKLADTKWAQRVIAERLVAELGREEVERRLALAWKIPHPDLTLDGILAGPPPPMPRLLL